MHIPNDRYYVETHEWVLVEDDIILVGITSYAQDQLGDLMYVGDFTAQGSLAAGDTACVVESVKAASDIYAPVSGQLIESNEQVVNNPELIQTEPYQAWLFKMRPDDMADVAALLTAKAYQALI